MAMNRILIVDDDEQITRDISAMIAQARPSDLLLQAYNGQMAWELLRQTDIDLVITDISMPVMNGLELISQMAAAELQIPLIVISGYDDYDFVHTSMRNGAYDYLLKPIQQEMLLGTVERALNQPRKGGGLWDRAQLAEAVFDYLTERACTPREAVSRELEEHHIGKDTEGWMSNSGTPCCST